MKAKPPNKLLPVVIQPDDRPKSAKFGANLKGQLRAAAQDGLRRYLEGEIPVPTVIEERDYYVDRLTDIIKKMSHDERVDLMEKLPERFRPSVARRKMARARARKRRREKLKG